MNRIGILVLSALATQVSAEAEPVEPLAERASKVGYVEPTDLDAVTLGKQAKPAAAKPKPGKAAPAPRRFQMARDNIKVGNTFYTDEGGILTPAEKARQGIFGGTTKDLAGEGMPMRDYSGKAGQNPKANKLATRGFVEGILTEAEYKRQGIFGGTTKDLAGEGMAMRDYSDQAGRR